MCDMSDINKITEGKVPAIYFMDRIERKSKSNQGRKFVPVDQWWPQDMEEVIITWIFYSTFKCLLQYIYWSWR